MVAIHIDLKSYCRQLVALAFMVLGLTLIAQVCFSLVQKSTEDARHIEAREKKEFVRILYSNLAKKRIADASMYARREWEVALCDSPRKLHFSVTDSEYDEFDSRLNELNINRVIVCPLGVSSAAACSLGVTSVSVSFPLVSMFLIAGIWLTGFARDLMRRSRN